MTRDIIDTVKKPEKKEIVKTTRDVMCKLIPLYTVEIRERDTKHDSYYETHIIADYIEGLIQGIVDYEINIEKPLDVSNLSFDIRDYLLMPCEGARGRKFHLFDIDFVDAASTFGGSLDETTFYTCYFQGDVHPAPGVRDIESSVFAEPSPVAECEPQPITRDMQEWEKWRRAEDDIMIVIYNLSRDHPYRTARVQEEDQEKKDSMVRMEERVKEWIEEEDEQFRRLYGRETPGAGQGSQ